MKKEVVSVMSEMSEMKRAVYVGPVVELRGEKAFVRLAYRSGVLLAQFDRIGLWCGDRFLSDGSGWLTHGRLIPRNIPALHAGDGLGFPAVVSHGWHEFPAQDFQFCDSPPSRDESSAVSP